MTATRSDIRGWFNTAQLNGSTHMIVATDTFDYDDYPVYVSNLTEAYKRVAELRAEPMTEVQEVYKISLGWEVQSGRGKVWNL